MTDMVVTHVIDRTNNSVEVRFMNNDTGLCYHRPMRLSEDYEQFKIDFLPTAIIYTTPTP